MAYCIKTYLTNAAGVAALKASNAASDEDCRHAHALYKDNTSYGPYSWVSGPGGGHTVAPLYVMKMTSAYPESDFHSYIAGVLGVTGTVATDDEMMAALEVDSMDHMVIKMAQEADPPDAVETNGIWR